MGLDWSSFIQTAKAETRERLQALNDGLLRLEGDPACAGLVDEVFRHAHSIKGSAQMVGLDLVGRVAHGLEDVLGAVRSGKLRISPPLLDLAFQGLDAIQHLLEDVPAESLQAHAEALAQRLAKVAVGDLTPDAAAATAPEEDEPVEVLAVVRSPQPPPAEAAPAEPAASAPAAEVPTASPQAALAPSSPAGTSTAADMMRVPTGRFDHLLALLGELTTLDQQERSLAAGLRGLQAGLRHLHASAADFRGSPPPEWWDALAEAQASATTLSRRARRLSTNRGMLMREVNDSGLDLRLLPASTLFERFPRPVRDLARSAGKEVHLVIEGEQTRLDRKVLDALYDPLLHLLRNAIDHGIETPADREAAGKPPAGTVTLRAIPHGREVVLHVQDDGRGVNVERVRQVACDRAFLTPAEAAAVPDEQILQILYRPGFSTAAQVTQVSGRGVGLDVVQSNVRDLKGSVRLQSEPGVGTTFTLSIPLTLATTRVLLLECGGHPYAIPGSLVRAVVDVPADKVRKTQGQPTIVWADRTVPLIALDRALGAPAPPAEERRPAAILETGGRTVGLVVDRLLGQDEVVLKPLDGVLRRSRFVSAGMLLGDGRIGLLLNAEAVLAAGAGAGAAPATPAPDQAAVRPRSILLADDTLTTREIERAILEAAGYEVVACNDGQEAWEQMAQRAFDLVVADVEMPRMDGITLTQRITTEPRTAHIPVIIITSLSSQEDRQRGLEAGASAYIVKSAFNQENLLDLVDRLIH